MTGGADSLDVALGHLKGHLFCQLKLHWSFIMMCHTFDVDTTSHLRLLHKLRMCSNILFLSACYGFL